MVDYSEIRHLYPSVSFFFARLGAFLESSGGCRPQVGLFASRDSALRVILTDLCPLLHLSLNWFQSLQEMSVEERVGSTVRSSKLEAGLSSNNNPVEVKVDILPP